MGRCCTMKAEISLLEAEMKSFSRLIGCAVLLLATGLILVALQLYAQSDTAAADQYVLGVVATESEDEWHAMMLESILDSAAAQGFDVITLHAARSTDAQAEQVRALIIYQVDAIVFSPIAETGWDYVFQEAHDAGIPIITVNKRASTPQEDLVSYVSYDYNATGHDAALAYLASPGEHDGNVVELCGTVDASFTREITGGFSSGLRQIQSPLRINYSVSTEFMRSRAKEVIEWLASNRYEMDLILAHSDGITIGRGRGARGDRGNSRGWGTDLCLWRQRTGAANAARRKNQLAGLPRSGPAGRTGGCRGTGAPVRRTSRRTAVSGADFRAGRSVKCHLPAFV